MRLMSANQITVRLVGSDEDNGAVRFDDFRSFCESVSKCLRKSETLVSSQPPRTRYRIADLRCASATITLQAIPPVDGPDRREEVLSLFQDTVDRLQTGRPPDRRVDRESLEAFHDLISPLHHKTKEVWIGSSLLTVQYEVNIQNILGSSVPSEGSVSGTLERVNVHNSSEFFLFPPLRGCRIKCAFPDSMFEQVREAIRGNVTVWGKLYFQPDRPFPHQVHVDKMELHPPDDHLPSLRDLKGIAPDSTGSLSSVEFVRAIRDREDHD